MKSEISQAAQFVVEIVNDHFEFSKRNKSEIDNCLPIINYLNENFEKYKYIGQNSIKIDINKEILFSRVKHYYKVEKKADYFIVNFKNKPIVFPTDKSNEYFNIDCFIRRKKSGSRKVPMKSKDKIIQTIKDNYPDENLKYFLYYYNTLFCYTKSPLIELPILKDNNIYLSLVESHDNDYKYEIRLLSNTNNINVIFTLKLIKYKDESNKLLLMLKSYLD